MKRKRQRAVRKSYIDKEKDNEGGESYLTGNFQCVLLYFMFKTFFHTLQKSIYELNKNMNFSRSTNAFELNFQDMFSRPYSSV